MNKREILDEVAILENGETSYQNCERLATLYCVLDHLPDGDVEVARRSEEESEFLQTAQSAPINEVLEVLDEHFNCLRTVYPKEYKSVMERIREIEG